MLLLFFQYMPIQTDHRDCIKYDMGAEEESNQEWTKRQSSVIYLFIHSTNKFLRIYYLPLSTKDRLVKAMVFPVLMYGRESWTLKKAEH